jgi:hypothetical protein
MGRLRQFLQKGAFPLVTPRIYQNRPEYGRVILGLTRGNRPEYHPKAYRSKSDFYSYFGEIYRKLHFAISAGYIMTEKGGGNGKESQKIG